MLWSFDAAEARDRNYWYLDPCGGRKPYLLTEIRNNRGATTRIEYRPSTDFLLRDRARGVPWSGHLPFPVQCVARIESVDQIGRSKLSTELEYHHGHWDGVDREFRGFGRVDQRDTELVDEHNAGAGGGFDAVSPTVFGAPLETRTWFHQGPLEAPDGRAQEGDPSTEFWAGDPPFVARPAAARALLDALPDAARRGALRALRGKPLRTEVYGRDGSASENRPYSVTEYAYDLRHEARGTAASPVEGDVFFAPLVAKRVTEWERGTDPMTQLEFTGDHDGYGQARLRCAVGVPRGRDFRVAAAPGHPYLAVLTQTTFAQRDDATAYLVDRAASVTDRELLNDGSPAAPALWAAARAGTAAARVIGQTLRFYDGAAFDGLPLGQIDRRGALMRVETLVLTPDTVAAAFATGPAAIRAGPYLSAQPVWPGAYPQPFRGALPPLAGYFRRTPSAGSVAVAGWYAAIERRRYDFQTSPLGGGRGNVVETRDELGAPTSIAYDAAGVLPVSITDAAGMTTVAANDYRVHAPYRIIDANGNRTEARFSPLGLLTEKLALGRPGENGGDAAGAPSTAIRYDLRAFQRDGVPAAIRTDRRRHHAGDGSVPAAQRDRTITTIEYWDGFGRALQTRTQAEAVEFGEPLRGDAGLPPDQTVAPGDATGRSAASRVTVSGWTRYDNKGRVIESFQPYFDQGYGYAPPSAAQRGRSERQRYDPRGNLVRVEHPDGSERRVIRGRPPGAGTGAALDNPDAFLPTPWEIFVYDENDNCGRTHPATSAAYAGHRNTPSSVTLDVLGRATATVERLGPAAADRRMTLHAFDLKGNVETVTDALGRVTHRQVHDLAGRVLRVEHLDAGTRVTVFDAAGRAVEQRDLRGSITLRAHDALGRITHEWARDDNTEAVTLRARLSYGDEIAAATAAPRNLRGRVHRQYDEAGVLTRSSATTSTAMSLSDATASDLRRNAARGARDGPDACPAR